MPRLTLPCAMVLCLWATSPAAAQSYEELLARGDSLTDALRPADALEAYRAAFALRQIPEVMWRFARAQVDVAAQLDPQRERQKTDSLYGVARLYADAAVRGDSLEPEAWFMVSNALGRLSRTRGGRERVRFAREVYDAASRALALDPSHDGAHHVLGAWHAEIMRLSGITKFFARTLLGAGFMSRASWDSAVVHLEQAVALNPDYLYHHLELAEVYLDVDRVEDARRELAEVTGRPPTSDVMDPRYQADAAQLLAELDERR